MVIGSYRSAKDLVDPKNGKISREIYVSEEIYAQELERVFARAWLLVGHESQVPQPNDFFTSRMGEESVILTRDRQGQVHVLLNTCMHRGMKVCRYDEGSTPVFSCPYHGWSFSTDGKLVSVPGELIGVPQFQTAYHGELAKNQWGLVHVPKMHNYNGWIWACWDKDAPDFIDYLGDMKPFLDAGLNHPDGSEGGIEVIGGVHKWIFPGNWKFGAENFGGDHYHNISHRSVDMIGISDSGRKGRHNHDGLDLRSVRVNLSVPGGGHSSAGQYFLGEDEPYVNGFATASPLVDEYFRHCHEERKKRLGEKARLHGGVGTVFPNTSFSAGRSIAVWHPAGPRVTEAWRWYFMPKDAPAEVKDVLRHYALRYAGPVGMTEQDDLENWNYATEASDGTQARRYPYNYQQGLRHDGDSPLAARLVTDSLLTEGTTEQNQRGSYWRWAEFMDAESWSELRPPKK